VQPVIRSDEVAKRLEDYYVDIRQQNAESSEDEDEPVPATVRTLDGVLRLSEACARMRLSEEVEMIDAEMAIALVKVSLEDIGYDPETGKMDTDWANGRTSWNQQDRIHRIKGIVEALETKDNGASKEDVIDTAVEAGIERTTANETFDNILSRGEIYEPETGRFRIS
jgi:replicative DNA helicase Mcm